MLCTMYSVRFRHNNTRVSIKVDYFKLKAHTRNFICIHALVTAMVQMCNCNCYSYFYFCSVLMHLQRKNTNKNCKLFTAPKIEKTFGIQIKLSSHRKVLP